MKVRFQRKFKKQYEKLDKKIQAQFEQRLAVFMDDPKHPLLKVHSLRGDRFGLQSLNVSANYRALFTQEEDLVVFHEIGTHSQLYS